MNEVGWFGLRLDRRDANDLSLFVSVLYLGLGYNLLGNFTKWTLDDDFCKLCVY